jgi:hypothetical protein
MDAHYVHCGSHRFIGVQVILVATLHTVNPNSCAWGQILLVGAPKENGAEIQGLAGL